MAPRLSGWKRLGIVLSGLWIVCVVLIACGQYFLVKQPARVWFVQDAVMVGSKWVPVAEAPKPTNDLETPAGHVPAVTSSEATRVIRYEQLAMVGLGPVVAFWVFGTLAFASFRWISSGFEGDAKAASQANKQAPAYKH